MKCRHCGAELEHIFVDLGFAPPSNAYLQVGHLSHPEVYFPLRVYVCDHCWLVQTEDFAEASALFDSDYAYFSSVSQSWLEHSRSYVENIIERVGLNDESFVVEIASNDGYLLRNFVTEQIPCIGIEPTESTADAAESVGVPTLREFFSEDLGRSLSEKGKSADLVIGNNVFAHVPDINDFSRGIARLLKPEGVVTLEFPHLLQLVRHTQFDTIYHEHFSYLALSTVKRIFGSAGLRIFDVEELSTHGGSLRVYGCLPDGHWETTSSVEKVISLEEQAGLRSLDTYLGFQAKVEKVKNEFLEFLLQAKQEGQRVLAYGAAAKGNTLLNFAGVKPDLLPGVCDAAPSKIGKYLPGSHIPILSPSKIDDIKPDYVVILPWNIAPEVKSQLRRLEDWGGRFVTAVPEICIHN